MLTPAAWWTLATGLGLVVAGWALSYVELSVVGAALLLCLAVAALWLLSRARLEVSRVVEPDRVTTGEDAVAWLTYRNLARRRSAPLIAREQFGTRLVEVALLPLNSGQTATTSYALPTTRRGRFTVGPLTVGATDVFGLIQATATRGELATLIVHPRVHQIEPLPSGRSRDLEGSSTGQAPSGGIAFHSLREYVRGDDLRLVHWRASAKAGTLLVRHNVDTVSPRTAVLLDTRADAYEDDEFELAVSLAASVVAASVRHHVAVQFHTTCGRSVSVAPGASGQDALDVLAELELSHQGDLVDVVSSRRFDRHGVSLAVITGRAHAGEGAEALLSGGRHRLMNLVLVGADPEDPHTTWGDGLVIGCRTPDEFVAGWEARVRR